MHVPLTVSVMLTLTGLTPLLEARRHLYLPFPDRKMRHEEIKAWTHRDSNTNSCYVPPACDKLAWAFFHTSRPGCSHASVPSRSRPPLAKGWRLLRSARITARVTPPSCSSWKIVRASKGLPFTALEIKAINSESAYPGRAEVMVIADGGDKGLRGVAWPLGGTRLAQHDDYCSTSSGLSKAETACSRRVKHPQPLPCLLRLHRGLPSNTLEVCCSGGHCSTCSKPGPPRAFSSSPALLPGCPGAWSFTQAPAPWPTVTAENEEGHST